MVASHDIMWHMQSVVHACMHALMHQNIHTVLELAGLQDCQVLLSLEMVYCEINEDNPTRVRKRADPTWKALEEERGCNGRGSCLKELLNASGQQGAGLDAHSSPEGNVIQYPNVCISLMY